jgi:hypothetical protein
MFKVLTRRLQYCNEVSASIKNAAPTQLQQLKTQLAEDMVKPVGLHTMGIPAAISTLGVIVSFAIPQLWLGYGVLAALSQPTERVFVWVVLVALLFAGINGVTMFMIGKGSMRAVRILSTAFYKMLLFTLHNRAWRKLIRQARDAHMPRSLPLVNIPPHYPRRDILDLASSRWLRNAARHGAKLAEKRPQLLASV